MTRREDSERTEEREREREKEKEQSITPSPSPTAQFLASFRPRGAAARAIGFFTEDNAHQ